MRFAPLPLILLIILAGCSSTNRGAPVATARAPSAAPARNPARDVPSVVAARASASAQGLDAVIGKDSAALIRLFGEPRLNVEEVNGRKLQFTGTACILDAYLYSDDAGRAERVTHIDARRRDGAEVDRTACINALVRR